LERHDTLNLGFTLGLESDISHLIDEAKVPLQPGDVMVVYTDGITEAINNVGVTYGIERLAEAVRSSHERPSRGIREAVLRNLRDHIEGQELLDDISLLVIKPA
jgi:sigma-B regulation protein RsbU (phosphoserine phosphatase)